MATKTKRKVNPAKESETTPRYGFRQIFFIDWRCRRIVHGQIELINTIRKPKFNSDGLVTGESVNHYYSIRTEISEQRESIHQEDLFITNTAASAKLAASITDFLKN